ncbi:L-threonylcarbamoyladenylate synthase [Candidatus Saccharibacteria bacterium]|nr:L-threonylcarbamoyladenylate synthase [Candidatus Saccharibacteria bacterium]
MKLPQEEWQKAAQLLRKGQIGILRTDTIYGIVARADDEQAVRRIHDVRSREPGKAYIVLAADEGHLYDPLPDITRQSLRQLWPGPVSVALPARRSPVWLPLIDNTLAYRIPAPIWLRELLEVTGPLLAPSANPGGHPPARTIEEAHAYFGDSVDFYLDGGTVAPDTPPSQLYTLLSDGSLKRLR